MQVLFQISQIFLLAYLFLFVKTEIKWGQIKTSLSKPKHITVSTLNNSEFDKVNSIKKNVSLEVTLKKKFKKLMPHFMDWGKHERR